MDVSIWYNGNQMGGNEMNIGFKIPLFDMK